ncbi:MAG: hypothetical protein ACUVRU_00310 [Anaerolineae bacterium]
MMTSPAPQTKRRLADWTTRDLLITLAISSAVSVAFILLNNLSTAVNAVNPIAGWAMGGLFRIPIRKRQLSLPSR